MPDIVPLVLAREELVYVMRAMHLPSVPGLAAPLLAETTPETEATALAVADRTLLARELVAWQGKNDRVLHAMVTGIIGRYAHPRACVRLELHGRASQSHVLLFSVAENGIVAHWPAPLGVEHFLAFPDWPSLLVYLRAIMPFDTTTQGPQEQVRVAGEVVNAALKATQDDAQQRLLPHMDVPLALSLAATLTQIAQRADVALFPGDPVTTDAQSAFTLFGGKGGIWQMRPLDDQGTWIEARGLTADGAYAALRPLFIANGPTA